MRPFRPSESQKAASVELWHLRRRGRGWILRVSAEKSRRGAGDASKALIRPRFLDAQERHGPGQARGNDQAKSKKRREDEAANGQTAAILNGDDLIDGFENGKSETSLNLSRASENVIEHFHEDQAKSSCGEPGKNGEDHDRLGLGGDGNRGCPSGLTFGKLHEAILCDGVDRGLDRQDGLFEAGILVTGFRESRLNFSVFLLKFEDPILGIGQFGDGLFRELQTDVDFRDFRLLGSDLNLNAGPFRVPNTG